jgi:tRNA (adenine37-N6)-methyltransferase
MTLKTIGLISSPFVDKFGTPRQSQIAKHTLSKLQLDPKKVPREMLEGLDIGSYIWVIFGFHLNRQKNTIVKVHPPRLRGKKMGVLATRSPHRPNPVGLSLGRIVSIEKNQLVVAGLDLVDQTPIYDIKPYLPEFDRPQERQLKWIQKNPFPKLRVRFAKNVLSLIPKDEQPLFKKQLKEILCEDPRPLAYLEKTSHIYWLRYGKLDVGFTIDRSVLTVEQIKSLPA